MKKKYKVLIVEDEVPSLKIYSNKLKICGYEVSMAISGDEAIRKAQSDQPDIILLDLILPGKDGFLVLEELKKNSQTNDIPVIILSNLGQEADIKRGKKLGAIDYLVKTDESLLGIVEKVKQYIN